MTGTREIAAGNNDEVNYDATDQARRTAQVVGEPQQA